MISHSSTATFAKIATFFHTYRKKGNFATGYFFIAILAIIAIQETKVRIKGGKFALKW